MPNEIDSIPMWVHGSGIPQDELEAILANSSPTSDKKKLHLIVYIKFLSVCVFTALNALLLFYFFGLFADYFNKDLLCPYIITSSVLNPTFMMWLAFRKFKIILIE